MKIKKGIVEQNENLDILSETEKIIKQINDTSKNLPYISLGNLLEKSAHMYSNNPAILMSDNIMTYKDVFEMVNSIAKKLLDMGIGRNDKVALIFDKGYEQVVAVCGVLYVGAAYVPIDSTFSEEVAHKCLEHAEVKCIITTKQYVKKYDEMGIKIWGFEEMNSNKEKMDIKPIDTMPDDIFAIIFTSGSTGTPKGVILEQQGVQNCFAYTIQKFSLSSKDRIFSVTDLCHDMSIFEMLGLLLVGGGIVMPSAQERRDVGRWIELLDKYQVTFWSSVPTFMEMLLIYIEGMKEEKFRLPMLKNVLLGGGFMSLSLYKRIKTIAKNVSLYNVGGPTETTMWNIMHKVTSKDIENELIPYGKPIWNTQYHILDENLEYVPINKVGMIYNSGIGVAKGYIDSELTEKEFIFHKKIKARLYRTGDLGRYNKNGEIEIVGRNDLQVKINGKRIELEEIELQIKKNFRVKEAAVVCAKDKKIYAFLTINRTEMEESNLWKDVFNSAYQDKVVKNTFYDFSGWKSSYTRKQIPDEEMMEWLSNTSRRILELHPSNVLEIGCGTGLIMYKIISQIKSYIGIDLSEIAIEELTNNIKSNNQIKEKAKVFQGSAEHLEKMKGKKFDTIIINSVIMFFDSEEYLTNVINECLELLTENGCLFIGDIIDYNLLKIFRTSVNFFKVSNGKVGELKESIKQDCIRVKDLLVAPQYFEKLLEISGNISGIEMHLKDMHHINEVSKFRYDVIIHKGIKNHLKSGNLVETLDFEAIDSKSKKLDDLFQRSVSSFVIKNIPNKLTSNDAHLLQLIENAEDEKNVLELKDELKAYQDNGIFPYELYRYGEEYGYKCAVKNTDIGHMEAYYSKELPFNITINDDKKNDVVNKPYKLEDRSIFIKELKLGLKKQLPEYMIPAYIDILETLPLLSNGKIDRKRLEKLANEKLKDLESEVLDLAFDNDCEHLWSQTLNISYPPDLEESFWQLGGHSLLALQFLNAIKNRYQCHISLTDFFSNPTLKYVLERIENEASISQDLQMNKENRHSSEDTVDDKSDIFALSELQQAYLIARKSKLPFTKIATHCYLELVFRNYSHETFENAVGQLVQKHDMLRCYFTDDGKQKILKKLELLPITRSDITGLSEEEYYAYLQNIRNEMNLTNIDYHTAPLFKLHVSQKANSAVVHFYYDGLIMDGYSKSVFLKDLDYFYGCGKKKKIPIKANKKFQNYIQHYEEMYKTGNAYEKAKKYWLDRIDTLPSIPGIPIVEENNSYENIESVQYKVILELEKWNIIKSYAQIWGVTSFSVILTVFCKVLARWSKEQNFVINIPLIDRKKEELGEEDFIGETATFLLFDFHNSGEPFIDLVKKNQNHLYELIENRNFTGIDILREMNRKNGKLGTGVVPIVFTSLIDIPEVEEENFYCDYFESYTSQVWMDAIASLTKRGIEFTWDCRKGIFEDAMMVKMQNAFINMLEKLANNIINWKDECKVPLPNFDSTLIGQINSTNHNVATKSIGAFIDEAIYKFQDRVAAIDIKKRYTYLEIGNKIKNLSSYLINHGIKNSDVIAVILKKGHEQLVAALGISYSGAVYAPIEYDLPIERVTYMLNIIQAKLVITDTDTISKINKDDFKIPCKDINCIEQNFDLGSISPRYQSEDSVFAIIFTSGSTGNPKGVYLKQKGVINCLQFTNQHLGITKEDRILSITNICHDMSIYDLYGFFICGGTIIFPSENTSKDPQYWISIIKKYNVTFWESVPTIIEMLLVELESGLLKDNELPSLKNIILGGEFLKPSLCKRIKKYAINATIYNTGGPTETTIWNIFHKITEEDIVKNHIPYGKPIWNTKYLILNDLLEIAPIGVPGVIYNSGVGIAKGYSDPKITREKFIFHHDLQLWIYNTGDMGRYTEQGEIDILGRIDSQVKINGKRIELEEIRNRITEYPGISDAVVKYDNRLKLIIAFYVGNKEASREKISAYLLKHLPRYMIPSIYQKIESLPILSNGKVDFSKLSVDMHNNSVEIEDSTYSKMQQIVFDIVKKHLGTKSVDPHDNFFMAGGDSLKGLKIASEINSTLYLNANITDILLSTSIDDFIKKIDDSKINRRHKDELVEEENTNRKTAPLSLAQEGIWFDCYTQNTDQFNILAYVDIVGKIDIAALEEALEKTIEKYKIFKVAIVIDDAYNPYQKIIEDRKIVLEKEDLENLSEENKKGILQKFENEVLHTLIDMEKDNLCRFIIFHMGKNRHRLYILNHHIITDDLSAKIFLKHLFENYFGVGETNSKDYTYLFFEHCRREKHFKFIKEDREFFQNLVNKAIYLDIPNSKTTTDSTYDGKTLRFEIDKKILVKFKEKCAELNVSLSVGFLTVYAMLLKELTGNKIIPIGMPFSSRREDGVDMIGLLVNLELICLQIDCRDEFESLVYQTHKQVMHYITKKYPPFVEMCRIFKASREKMKLPHHIVYNYLEEYESLQNNEIVISPITYIDNQVRHDFGLLINNSSSECYGEFTYNTNFLGSDIAEYARDIYLKLLNSIINQ